MSDQIVQGLQISFLGMGLTFFALAVLILIMILLDRLFRSNGRASESERSGSSLGALKAGVPRERDAQEEEVAVAIAVALAFLGLQVGDRGSLGDTLAEEKGAWWKRGGSAGLMRRIARRQNGDP